MWELLTGERPFRGLLEGDVVYGVCETGLRPQFPPGAPEAFVSLAQQCWAQNASDRPTAGQVGGGLLLLAPASRVSVSVGLDDVPF